MSWFNKIVARSLIRIPDELKPELYDIANKIRRYYYDKGKQVAIVGTINFIDPYTNKQRNVNVVARPYHPKMSGVAAYSAGTKDENGNEINGLIMVVPRNMTFADKKRPLLQVFYEYLEHEITHAIDPKYQEGNAFEGQKKQLELQQKMIEKDFNYDDYYNFLVEFDAFSRQITERIKNFIQDDVANAEQVLNWLRSNNENIYTLSFLSNYKGALESWIRHDENPTNKYKYIKILKQRIYNELFNKNVKNN